MALWFWFILSGLSFALGEYLSKVWALNQNHRVLVLMVLSYVVSSLAWAPIIRARPQLAMMGMLWMLVATCATLTLGVGVFHEKLEFAQWVGVCLAIVSMMLIGSK
jgi:multidrug transporter EmrE-like cation transporter